MKSFLSMLELRRLGVDFLRLRLIVNPNCRTNRIKFGRSRRGTRTSKEWKGAYKKATRG